MEKNNKSKITVIGFVVFVLLIYTGSYFYTRDNNERLLSSPRLVMLVGPEDIVNTEFSSLVVDQRRTKMRLMYELGTVYTVSQLEYDGGVTDIAAHYKDNNIGDIYHVADCMDYSETLEQTMVKVDKNALKATWIFAACGIRA